MARKPTSKPVEKRAEGNVIKNLTDQPLSIGGVTISPRSDAAIPNWPEVKKTGTVQLWLKTGVISS